MKGKGFKSMLTLTLALGVAGSIAAQPPEAPVIVIDEIVENGYIRGEVSNLLIPQEYKVLVYVFTDKWYIHPYVGQGEGKSWAAIDSRGHWLIPTKKWGHVAKSVAVLVVDLAVAEKAKSPLDDVLGINAHALIIYSEKELTDKEWYGRL